MKNAITLAVLMAAAPVLQAGQMYKWEDENGRTVYSQTPPATAESQIVKPPPPPATDPAQARKELDASIQRLDEADKVRIENEKARGAAQKKNDNQAQVRASCKASREQIEELERGPPQKILIGPDGKAKRLSYEELQAEITEAKAYIEKNCTGM